MRYFFTKPIKKFVEPRWDSGNISLTKATEPALTLFVETLKSDTRFIYDTSLPINNYPLIINN